MATRKLNPATILIVLIVVIAVFSQVNFAVPNAQFSFIPPCQPYPTCVYSTTQTTVAVSSSQAVQTTVGPVTIDVWQHWTLFDIYGKQFATYDSRHAPFPFNIVAGQTQIIPTANAGFIRIDETHYLENTVPGFDSNWGYEMFTVQMTGQVLIDGKVYAPLQPSPFPAPDWLAFQTIKSYLPNAVAAGALFFTGEGGGESKDSAFYLIFNHALRPSACDQYPASCVDMTSIANGGKDVSLSATFLETWTQWSIDYNPLKFFGPCDFTAHNVLGEYEACIKALDTLGPTPVTMEPKMLSTLGYFTSINGQATFIPTVTATTFGTNTVFFTTTSGVTKWGVIYTNTTVVGTLSSNPAPSLGNLTSLNQACTYVPWLCESTFGIANWIWVLAGLGVILIIWGSRRGGSSITVNLVQP